MSFREGMSLEGKIVIKVQLGNDIRKMLIHNDDITYDELVLMMQRVYKGVIKQEDEIIVKYKDEDGDLITMFDSADVSFALQMCRRQLKLVLYLNGLERNFDDSEIATIRTGLCAVRDMANRLLDQINAKTRYLEDVDAAESEDASVIEDLSPEANKPVVDSKEFDPLQSGGHIKPQPQANSSTGQADPVTSHHPASQLTGSQLTGSQYSNSQYGDQAAKSFDQMTMSEHQNPSTAASLQSPFGSTAYDTHSVAPASASQLPNSFTSQAPASFVSSASGMPSSYYGNVSVATSSQYSTPQAVVTQATTLQQPSQQFNYSQWQQTSTAQPGTNSQMVGQPSSAAQPGIGQQMGGQQMGGQQYYGGYGVAGQQMPAAQNQQNMYPQPQLPTPGGYNAGGTSTNPYSGQIRGSYPRATGSYPQLAQQAQRPLYPGAPRQ